VYCTAVKEEGAKTYKRTGELHYEKIMRFKEQMGEVSCMKDLARISAQSCSLEMSQTANDIDETRTDFLRYLQKEEERPMII
jgi:hypothetical protein